MNRLADKVAVVTGANSGVGAAIAKLFAAEGAKVVMSARRAAALEEVAAQIAEAGGEAYVVPTDISKPEDPENLMAAAVEKYGKIDILVNNAGVLEAGLKPIDRPASSPSTATPTRTSTASSRPTRRAPCAACAPRPSA